MGQIPLQTFFFTIQLESLKLLTSPLQDESVHLIIINITVLIHEECSPETTQKQLQTKIDQKNK